MKSCRREMKLIALLEEGAWWSGETRPSNKWGRGSRSTMKTCDRTAGVEKWVGKLLTVPGVRRTKC